MKLTNKGGITAGNENQIKNDEKIWVQTRVFQWDILHKINFDSRKAVEGSLDLKIRLLAYRMDANNNYSLLIKMRLFSVFYI